MKTFLKASTLFIGISILLMAVVIIASHKSDRSVFLMEIQLSKMARIAGGDSYTNIIMGDSRGLATNYDKTTAKKYDLYNYSMVIIGGFHPYVYFLEKYLKHNKPPKVIFFTFLLETFSTKSGIFTEPPREFGSGALYRASRYYAFLDLFRDPIFSTFSFARLQLIATRVFPNKFYVKLLEPLWLKEKFLDLETGFATINGKHIWPAPAGAVEKMSQPFAVSELNMNLMRQMLTNARQNKIKVVVMNIPMPESLYKRRIETNYFESYYSALDTLQQEFSDVLVIGNKPYPYPNKYFSDYHHLNDEGAKLFNSGDFIELLRKFAAQ